MSSLFGSTPWSEALTEGFGLRPEVLTAPRGQLAYCRVDDLKGPRCISLPFCDYYDPDVHDTETWNELTAELLASGLPVRFRTLRNDLLRTDPRLEIFDTAAWHAADTTAEVPDLWARLHPSARQNARRAERYGVKVRFSDSASDVSDFHALHVALRKQKYGMLAQPVAFFQAIRDAFAPLDGFHLALAEQDGRLVAGTMYLDHAGVLFYKFNASTDNVARPNDLLTWAGIQLARERNVTSLDFGLSDWSQDGLLRFKRKFATEERPILFLRNKPPADQPTVPDTGEGAALLGKLADLFTQPEVPQGIAARAGDLLYRHFC